MTSDPARARAARTRADAAIVASELESSVVARVVAERTGAVPTLEARRWRRGWLARGGGAGGRGRAGGEGVVVVPKTLSRVAVVVSSRSTL